VTKPLPPPGFPGRQNFPKKVWGPGSAGKRRPLLSLTYNKDVDLRWLFRIAAALGIVILVMIGAREKAMGRRANAGDEPKDASAPVGSGVAAVDSSRPRPFQGLLDDAKDDVPVESLETSEAYRTLLWNLKNYSVAEVSSLAETISADELLRAPAEYRGHFVRVSGVLIKELAPERLATNAAGFDTRWRSFIVDTMSGEENNAFMFDLFTKPERDFSRQDAVTVEGVFLQVVSYDSRSGKKKVPFIQARSVNLLVGEKVSAIGGSTNILLILAIVLASLPLLAYGLQTFSRRKDEKDLVDALAKVRARHPPHFKKRGETPSAAAPVAPAATPPPLPSPASGGGGEAPPASAAPPPPSPPPPTS
jgi:hypothetical protein